MNTVMGMPEPKFREMWLTTLWSAMAKTGKGYPRPSTRHSGKGKDRRADKLALAKLNARVPVFTGKLNYRRSERPVG